GMRPAPGALLDDGLLDVVVCEHVSKMRFLTSVVPRVFKGTHVELPNVHVFRAAEVEISSDRPFVMYADGDPIGELPIRAAVLEAAVMGRMRSGGAATRALWVHSELSLHGVWQTR